MAEGRNKLQFSLAQLMAFIVVCALILGYLASRNLTYDVSFHCFRMPHDDERLATWYADQEGVGQVSVTREGKEISVRVQLIKRGGIADQAELPVPPMSDLGYGVEAVGYGSPSLVGRSLQRTQGWAATMPAMVWFAIAVMGMIGLVCQAFRRNRYEA